MIPSGPLDRTLAGPPRPLFPKQHGRPASPAVGLDEAIVAQHGDPGIPVAAAWFFAEHSGELIGVDVKLALGREGPQHFRSRGRQPIAP